MAKVQKKKVEAPVSFWGAVKNYWRGYVRFSGTSTRREYWFAWLFCVCLGFVAQVLSVKFGVIASVVFVAMFLPSRALAFRRFQDVGLSGWWYLIPYCVLLIWSQLRLATWTVLVSVEYMPWDLLMYAGFFVLWLLFLLYVFVQPSKTEGNKYRK